MKIVEIINKDNVFEIVYEKSFWDGLFGDQFITKKFTHLVDKKYTNFKDAGVYLDENGKLIGHDHQMTLVLDNYRYEQNKLQKDDNN